jgi:hypothetical protein
MTKKDESLSLLQELMSEVEEKPLMLKTLAPEEVLVLEVDSIKNEVKERKDGSGSFTVAKVFGYDIASSKRIRNMLEGPAIENDQAEYLLLYDYYKAGNYHKYSGYEVVDKITAIKTALAAAKALKAKGESANDVSAA